MTRADYDFHPFQVNCPAGTCGACAGQKCRRYDGSTLPEFHGVRVDLANGFDRPKTPPRTGRINTPPPFTPSNKTGG